MSDSNKRIEEILISKNYVSPDDNSMQQKMDGLFKVMFVMSQCVVDWITTTYEDLSAKFLESSNGLEFVALRTSVIKEENKGLSPEKIISNYLATLSDEKFEIIITLTVKFSGQYKYDKIINYVEGSSPKIVAHQVVYFLENNYIKNGRQKSKKELTTKISSEEEQDSAKEDVFNLCSKCYKELDLNRYKNGQICPHCNNKIEIYKGPKPKQYGYTSFKGRASRGDFISFLIVIIMYLIALVLISKGVSQSSDTLKMIIGLILLPIHFYILYLLFVQKIRRAHDSNSSGWLILVPIYNIYLLLFKKGTDGINKYGVRES